MDPAALGTLTLGLDDVRRGQLDEIQPIRRAVRFSRPAGRRRFAGTLAGALRAMADVLEPGLDPAPRSTRRLTS